MCETSSEPWRGRIRCGGDRRELHVNPHHIGTAGRGRQEGYEIKNTANDLSNYLFEEIERLQDTSLTEEELERNIRRSEAVVKVSEQIIKNGALQLRAAEVAADYGGKVSVPLLGINGK